MSKRSRKPPRYVPTLTEVVTEAVIGGQMAADAVPDAGNTAAEVKAQATAHVLQMPVVAAVSAMPEVQPEDTQSDRATAEVSTALLAIPSAPEQALQEEGSAEPEVSAPALHQPAQAFSLVQATGPVAIPAGQTGAHLHWLPDMLEEAVVHRVMQRVDIALDQRLRDAIATVIQEQTRSLLPRLREEVESVVRQVVYEAVADEVADG